MLKTNLLLLLGLSALACAELAPDPPRPDVMGCYRLDVPVRGAMEGPAAPPAGLDLRDGDYLPAGASAAQARRHRFDARRAREAYFIYPDTAFRVAWWWESEDQRRLGVGNHNVAAAFFIVGVVRGERFEGEMRRWLYDGDVPLAGPDAWTLPVSGRRDRCDAL